MSKGTARQRVKRATIRPLSERLPAPLRPWYQAARPRSLPATYAAIFTGGAVAIQAGVFEPIRFLLALIGALLLQIASNLINEYVDYRRGTDALKVAGMGMVLSEGKLSAQQVLIGAIVTTVGGALIGLVLVALSGTTLLWIGMIGVAAVVLYTAGPLPLSHLGLGEVTAFLCFGPLMTFGTYYAVSGQESVPSLLAGVPLGFTVAAILHANNMRDIEADRAANKRTLAVRFGLRGAFIEYNILIYGAYVALAALIVAGIAPLTTAVAFVTLWEAVWLVRVTTRSKDAQALHRAQGRTARLHWWLGLALTVGWLLAAFFNS
ncbi:MAG: 1,4-dihydroxy-2-naphthoate octaprenyltransferase [Anaerolineae bacterium]|nr:1,4-dihydroxy-2-naphthoate octaprenyltransferase [Anaerolineae bacterium]MDW8298555.1 1,4-dihydroxy-2-naphthoate octaprenyltransferase [Anaerolineae bacterium]